MLSMDIESNTTFCIQFVYTLLENAHLCHHIGVVYIIQQVLCSLQAQLHPAYSTHLIFMRLITPNRFSSVQYVTWFFSFMFGRWVSYIILLKYIGKCLHRTGNNDYMKYQHRTVVVEEIITTADGILIEIAQLTPMLFTEILMLLLHHKMDITAH